MIGYILLITAAVVMSIILYQWMKTYIPKEPLKCPDGVSIFIKEVNFNCTSYKLDITLKNNGMFNIAGYFIHATNSSDQELATIDLSQYLVGGAINVSNSVIFTMWEDNSFKPNDEIINRFNLSATGFGQIHLIEIIPTRFQEEENKIRFVSCGNSKVKEVVSC